MTPRPQLIGPALLLGFSAALIMWIAGYALHLPGVRLPAPLLLALLLLPLIGIGVVAGRGSTLAHACRLGAAAGFVAGLLNLLVLGSVPPEDPARREPLALVMWAAGWVLSSAALSSLFAMIAAGLTPTAREASPAPASRWLARFALLTVASVLTLIVIGGVVTSAQAGMAVPDWPTSEGFNMFLYPIARMTGGRLYEHAHRLFGAYVGLATFALMVYGVIVDRRRWVRWTLLGAFLLVCTQGVLGGGRVELDARALAFIHGVSAQLVFALLCAIAAFLSPTWLEAPPPAPGGRATRGLALAAWIILLVQVALGAAGRHFDANLHAIFAHVGFSVVALIAVIALGARLRGRHADLFPLRRIGAGLLHGVSFQMFLGLAALWAVLSWRESDPTLEVILATAHQTVGAIIFALATLALVWTRRRLAAT